MLQEYTRLQIQYWVTENISPHCGSCKTNCCNTSKLLINIRKEDQPALDLFSSAGIRIYNLDKLDASSVEKWMKNRLNEKVLTREGIGVPKPSIIEAPVPKMGIIGPGMSEHTDYVLYANNCPFYLKKKGCMVHGDSRRPRSCREYPLTFEAEGEKQLIDIHDSCPVMKSPELRRRLQQSFPDIPKMSVSGLFKQLIIEVNRDLTRKRMRKKLHRRRRPYRKT